MFVVVCVCVGPMVRATGFEPLCVRALVVAHTLFTSIVRLFMMVI